jgi:hypothetical protein
MDWKKLAGLGLMAAAPFTGGTSMAWGLPLILGAAGGALNGGVEGAISGGAGGAAGAMSPNLMDNPMSSGPIVSDAHGSTQSIWQKLGGIAKDPDVLKAGGAALLGAVESSAQDRQHRGMTRGRDLQDMQAADYLSSGNAGRYSNPQGLPTYGLMNGAAPSSNVQAAASELEEELMKRLQKGTESSLFEKLAGPAGLAGVAYGGYKGRK